LSTGCVQVASSNDRPAIRSSEEVMSAKRAESWPRLRQPSPTRKLAPYRETLVKTRLFGEGGRPLARPIRPAR
jgi:hypothetical protein